MNQWILISVISLIFGLAIGTAIGATCFTNYELSKTYTDSISAINGIIQTILAFIAILGALLWKDQFISSKKLDIISDEDLYLLKKSIETDLKKTQNNITYMRIMKNRRDYDSSLANRESRVRCVKRLIKNYEKSIKIIYKVKSIEGTDMSNISYDKTIIKTYLLLTYVDRDDVELYEDTISPPEITPTDLTKDLDSIIESTRQ